MPNTPEIAAVVTVAYTKWQKRLTQYKEKVPGVTKADVAEARSVMEKAIREWEKPGPDETKSQAKANRKPDRKRWWPKF